MALIDETSAASANLAGLRTISNDQRITFTLYVRYVLPIDGYVFWLGTSNDTQVKCSLHITADKQQNEDETIAVNRVVMTTGEPVQQFNAIGPNEMWVGEVAGVRFAFSRSGPRYRAAELYHYNGNAVYPALGNMLVAAGQQFPKNTQVISNSLPMWLTLATYDPIWLVPANPGITLYPSYAVPDNLAPPYGVVHIPPESTEVLQAVPLLGPVAPVGRAALGTVNGTTLDSTHWQLVSDHVRVTLYGLTNAQMADWMDLVNRYSFDTDEIGIMSASPIRDEKRTQSELAILAMKKTISYTVSYYQARANAVARQLIEKVSVEYAIGPFAATPTYAINPNTPMGVVVNVPFIFSGTLSGYTSVPVLTYSIQGSYPARLGGVTEGGWSTTITAFTASGHGQATTILVTDSVNNIIAVVHFPVSA